MLVGVVACPENTSGQCKGDNGSDVGRVKGALCGMFCVVPANMGMMERVAGGLGVHGQSVSGLLSLPLLDHGVDGINEAVLGHGYGHGNCIAAESAAAAGTVSGKMVPAQRSGS